MFCVAADSSRESERTFAVGVDLNMGKACPFEEGLRWFGWIIDDHDSILVDN